MKITLTSVFVADQEKALRFYTDVLGFVAKNDVPMGEHRWLTVVSPDQPDGVELVLEPDEHPADRPRGPLHPAAHADGAGHHRGARRHLRQPAPDRRHVTRAAQSLAVGGLPARRASPAASRS